MADADEKRLARLQRAIERHESRMRELRDIQRSTGLARTEAQQRAVHCEEQFKMELAITFRDPERAFEVWKRQEWTATNIVFSRPSHQEVGERTQKAFEDGLFVNGLKLRGQRILGRSNASRRVAETSLKRLGPLRRSWLEALDRVEALGRADTDMERQITRIERRHDGLRERKAEVFQTYTERARERDERERELQKHRDLDPERDGPDWQKDRGRGREMDR
jgi:hypothetical protein